MPLPTTEFHFENAIIIQTAEAILLALDYPDKAVEIFYGIPAVISRVKRLDGLTSQSLTD
jgi:hypothetical protein